MLCLLQKPGTQHHVHMIGPCPEPAESTSHCRAQLLSYCCTSTHSWAFQTVSSFQVSQPKFCMYSQIPHTHTTCPPHFILHIEGLFDPSYNQCCDMITYLFSQIIFFPKTNIRHAGMPECCVTILVLLQWWPSDHTSWLVSGHEFSSCLLIYRSSMSRASPGSSRAPGQRYKQC